MNNENTGWDLTVAAPGEMEMDPLAELYSDPEYLEILEARKAEALEYQMANDKEDALSW